MALTRQDYLRDGIIDLHSDQSLLRDQCFSYLVSSVDGDHRTIGLFFWSVLINLTNYLTAETD